MRLSSLLACLALALSTAAAALAGGGIPAPTAPVDPPAPTAPRPADAPLLASPTAARARARFDTLVHDFGSVPHGTVVRKRFRVENVGDAPLEILGLKTSCGCTAAEPTKRRLLPGESAEIEVRFDSGHKPAPRGGRQRYVNRVEVTTNDPDQRAQGRPGLVELLIQGDIVALFRLAPEVGLLFPSYVQGAAAPTGTVQVLETAPLAGAAPATLVPGPEGVHVLAAPPGVEVTGVRPVVLPDARGVAVDVRLRSDVRAGLFDATIRVATGCPGQPEVVIPVRGLVQPSVQALPQRMIIVRDFMQSARSVRIVGPESQPVEVVAVEVVSADGAPPQVTAERAGPGEIHVSAAASATATAATAGSAGEILVFAASATHPLVRVPFLVRANPQRDVDAAAAAGVRLMPIEIYFGDLPAGREIEAPIDIARTGGAPLELAGLAVTPAGAAEARVESREPGEHARLSVRIAARAPGPIAGRVAFTPRAGAAPLGIDFAGRVVALAAVEPEALAPIGDAPASVSLARTDRAPARALSAADPSGRLDVSVEPGKDGAPDRIVARARTRLAPGSAPLRCDVLVKTDIPGEAEVRVPAILRP